MEITPAVVSMPTVSLMAALFRGVCSGEAVLPEPRGSQEK